MIATNAVTVTFYISQKIAEGLADGNLERVGGVIRQVGSKKVVAWLRELSSNSQTTKEVAVRTGKLEHMTHIHMGMSALTLSTVLSGFVVINHRLDGIENRLKAMQEQLNTIDQKIDLSFYTTFRAALDMAKRAFTMDDLRNRKAMALQAIQSFAESEHVYTAYLEQALQHQQRAVNEYLLMLALIYLADTRCYLELEEYATALKRLQKGVAKLQVFTKRYVEMLLTSNPAAYINPFLKEEISLTRLTRIYQWLEPGVKEADVFEKLRQHLFDWHVDASKLGGFRWLKELPPAILSKAEFEKKGYFKRSDQVEQALTCLPKAMTAMELAIETYNRLQGYQTEIQAMKELGLSFQEWLSLRPQENSPENAQMFCIMAA